MMVSKRISRCFVTSVLSVAMGACCMTLAFGAESPAGTSESAGGTALGGTITSDDYVIQVDDVLTIDGQHYAEFNPLRTYTVGKDKTIKLFYIGRVQAAGLTKRQLEEEIEKRYENYFKNLYITVTVRSKTYVVMGEVNHPGIHPLQLKTTLLIAIGRAGDFTDYANQSKVIVIRTVGGEVVRHSIDCKSILKGETEDFVIQPNDVILVARKGLF